MGANGRQYSLIVSLLPDAVLGEREIQALMNLADQPWTASGMIGTEQILPHSQSHPNLTNKHTKQ
jgi:hypothetical protein